MVREFSVLICTFSVGPELFNFSSIFAFMTVSCVQPIDIINDKSNEKKYFQSEKVSKMTEIPTEICFALKEFLIL